MFNYTYKKYFHTDTVEIFVTVENEVIAICHGTIDGRLESFADNREIDAADIRNSLHNAYAGFDTMPVTFFCCYPQQVKNVRNDELENAGLYIIASWQNCTDATINGKTLTIQSA